jgi:hypothetical protein
VRSEFAGLIDAGSEKLTTAFWNVRFARFGSASSASHAVLSQP